MVIKITVMNAQKYFLGVDSGGEQPEGNKRRASSGGENSRLGCKAVIDEAPIRKLY